MQTNLGVTPHIVLICVAGLGIASLVGCGDTDANEAETSSQNTGKPFHGAFKTVGGKLTNGNHADGRILVLWTDDTNKKNNKAALVFLQRRSPFKNGGFVCESASWDSKDEVWSCERKNSNPKEQLFVALHGSPYCKKLYVESKQKILAPNAKCPQSECICYALRHDGKIDVQTTAKDLLPPGNGAGSGGSHN